LKWMSGGSPRSACSANSQDCAYLGPIFVEDRNGTSFHFHDISTWLLDFPNFIHHDLIVQNRTGQRQLGRGIRFASLCQKVVGACCNP